MSIVADRMIWSAREQQIGIGRSWHYDLLQSNEAIISSSLLDSLSLSVGDLIRVSVNLSDYIMPQLEQLNITYENLSELYSNCCAMILSNSLLHIDHSFKIVDSVSSPEGKWPTSYGSVIVISTQTLQNLLNDFVDSLAQSEIVSLEEEPAQWMNDWTMQYLIISSKHQSLYTSSDYSQWRILWLSQSLGNSMHMRIESSQRFPIVKTTLSSICYTHHCSPYLLSPFFWSRCLSWLMWSSRWLQPM